MTSETHAEPGGPAHSTTASSDPRERRLQRRVGRRRARAMAPPGALVTDAAQHRAPRGFAARESPEYGHLLMVKMIEQTLAPYEHLPGVQRALALGVTPLLDNEEGRQVRAELGAQLLYGTHRPRKWFGVRFTIDGMVFQYGLTSGAKSVSLDGDNDWVDSLVDLVDQYAPAELCLGPASRLARLKRYFTVLEHSLRQTRTLVRTSEVPSGMDLNDVGGRAQWDALAAAAEWDYTATVTRLLTGVVFELKRNGYPRSELGLPPGYVKPNKEGTDQHQVRPTDDPSVRDVVRRFIELAASTATPTEIAAELGKLGLETRSPSLRKQCGPLLAHEVKNPERLVQTLFEHLPVYLDGQYRFQHEVSLPNLEEIHGFAVRRVHRGDSGYIDTTLAFGLPPGGWHDEETIKAAIDRRLTGDTQTSTVRQSQKPLAGLVRYDLGRHEYALLANETTSYELRRRPIPTDGDGSRPTFGADDGHLIGRFKALTVHRALAGMLRQLADGVPSRESCPRRPPADPAEADGLRKQAQSLQEEARRARALAVKATTNEQSDEYATLAEDAEARLQQVLRQVRSLTAERRPLPGHVMDANQIAALVVVLEQLRGAADWSVVRQVRSVFQQVRILDADPGVPLATLEATVSLRTHGGSTTIGPLRAPIQNRRVAGVRGSDNRRAGFQERNRHLAVALWLEGAGKDERRALCEQESFSPRSFVRRMETVLHPLVQPHVASALIDCPLVEVRRAAIQPFLDHGLPIDLDPALITEVQNIYRPRGFTWTKGWCPGGMARQRAILAFIDHYAPDPELGLPLETVRRTFDVHETVLYRMLHSGRSPYGRSVESPAPWYATLESHRSKDGDGPAQTFVRVRQCPHCGRRSLLQPLRVPEVPGHLLCTEPGCRRSLLVDLPFADGFFEPWDGPQTGARRLPDASQAIQSREWMSQSGRVIAGAVRIPVVYPSPWAPRGGA